MSGQSQTRRQPPKVARPTPVPRVAGPLDTLAPDDAVAWLAAQPTLPAMSPGRDGHHLVTVVWRDAGAQAVLLFANRLTDETSLDETLLARVPGTDVWHATFELEDDFRASYCFLVHTPGDPAPWLRGDQVSIRHALDAGQRDPHNPETCRNRAGVDQSVLSLPAAPDQPWLAERPGVRAGTVTSHEGPQGREVWLYDPPRTRPEDELPLLCVLDGEVWSQPGWLPTTLDNLLADDTIAPLRAVFASSGGREQRWEELSADGSGVSHLVDGLIGWVSDRRGVRDEPRLRAVAGQSLGGLTALRAGLLHPDVVGTVISHSASLWQDDLTGLLAERSLRSNGRAAPRILLGHGRQEWLLAPLHEQLAGRLVAHDIEVCVSTANGGHDYAWWRSALADALVWAFAAEG